MLTNIGDVDGAVDTFFNTLPTAIRTKLDNMQLSPAQRAWFQEDFLREDDILNALNALEDTPLTSALNNWKNLRVLEAVEEAKNFDVITKTARTDAFIRYYEVLSFKTLLRNYSLKERLKFMDEFGSTSQLDSSTFSKLVQKPKGIDLILAFQKGTKVGPDVFTKQDIIDIIQSDLRPSHIELLSIKSRTILATAISKYIQEITAETIALSRLYSLQFENGFGSFVQNLSNNRKKLLQSVNRLIVKTQVYQDNIPVGGLKTEKFIAGQEFFVKEKIFGGTTLPDEVIEPDYTKFEFFRRKAIDYVPQPRENDTELKYIFNLLENHWDTGNRFVIEMESTLYACQSCQGYLVYLKELAKQQGKTVEIKVIAHKDAMRIPELIDLIK